MSQYRIEESRPDWYKGLGPMYQICDANGPIRQLKWDYKPTAEEVCASLNNGQALMAEISYKLHSEKKIEASAAHFAENEEVIYALKIEDLPASDRAASTFDEKRAALLRNGYSEIIIHWETIKTL